MPETTEYTHHIEIPGFRGEPIDIRLKDEFKTKSTCKFCKKTIYRGKTRKGKMMSVSMSQINSYGDKGPVSHFDDCPNFTR